MPGELTAKRIAATVRYHNFGLPVIGRAVLWMAGFAAVTLAQDSDYWNKVYSSGQPIFKTEPTALLVSAIADRQPGKALDIGMGQGRNAVFLARRGWDVTGFDPSSDGVRIARAEARKAGVVLHAIVAREEEFDPGENQWDLIVLSYVRRTTAADPGRLWRALRPGGLFVYENNNAGPRNEMPRSFLRFRIIRFEDVDAHSDWHPERKQRVERLIAEKAVE